MTDDDVMTFVETLMRGPLHGDVFAGLTEQQLRFINDPAKHKAARTSRQAGKSEAAMALLTATCLERKGTCIYINRSIKQAKATIWSRFEDFFAKHDVVFSSNLGDKFFRFENGSILYILGSKDKLGAEFFRGQIYRLIVVDETQSFPDETLKYLLDKVLDACLFKEGGSLVMCGTPDTVCNGIFHDATKDGSTLGWSTHHWTWRDNPGLPNKEQFRRDLLKSHGWTGTEPEYQSEWEGIWTKDVRTLLFEAFTPVENEVQELPIGVQWQYTLGCDVGATRDLSAFVLIAWSVKHPCAYVVSAVGKSGRDVTAYCQEVQRYWQKIPGLTVIMDDGALGAGYLKELQNRYDIPALGKTKTAGYKAGMVRIINDNFRLKQIKLLARTTGPLRDQLQMIRFDPKKQIELEGDPCDYGDAFLYGYSHAYQFLYKAPAAPLTLAEQHAAEAQARWERTQRQFRSDDERTEDDMREELGDMGEALTEVPAWPE